MQCRRVQEGHVGDKRLISMLEPKGKEGYTPNPKRSLLPAAATLAPMKPFSLTPDQDAFSLMAEVYAQTAR